jgi:nucleotide-binding universal stress UspA family protein
MMRVKKILFPTDFSRCAGQAFTHALYLTQRYGAEMHMLHAVVLNEDDPNNPEHHFPGIEDIVERLNESIEERMTSEIEASKALVLNIVKAQRRGISPATVILDYAQDNDIDLIVMGTQGLRGLSHLLMGSVAEEVVRLARCPVFTVREKKQPKPIEDFERILAPVDFSDHSKKSLSYAKVMAESYGAKLQILHVIEENIHPAFYASGKSSIFELIPNIKEKSEQALKQLLADAGGPKVDAEVHVVEGRATQEIVKFAEKYGSDLIVIATHGLTGIEHLLLGSVAEKVVRMSSSPVFTVKPFGKSLI